MGRVHWGIAASPALRFSSVEAASTASKASPKVVVSMNEIKELRGSLTSQGYEVVEAGGAGYKILSVVLGLADLYVTAKPSTYKWDSCAGHAILVILFFRNSVKHLTAAATFYGFNTVNFPVSSAQSRVFVSACRVFITLVIV